MRPICWLPLAKIATLVTWIDIRASDLFNYFTVASNMLAVISLVFDAFAMAVGRSSRILGLRGAVTQCITTIIFAVILAVITVGIASVSADGPHSDGGIRPLLGDLDPPGRLSNCLRPPATTPIQWC